jgi:hypothetical protein
VTAMTYTKYNFKFIENTALRSVLMFVECNEDINNPYLTIFFKQLTVIVGVVLVSDIAKS